MIQMLLTQQREFAKGLKRAGIIKAVFKEYGLLLYVLELIVHV